jgi:hypothetical protein
MVVDDFPGGVLGWMFIDGGDLRHNDIAGSGRGRGYAVVATDVVAGPPRHAASVLIRSGDSQLSGTVRFCRHGTDGMRDPEFVG